MARERSDWSGFVRSVRGNRAGRATFYKPVCVIAAIDLADIGRLDSALLHSELIVRRFGEYVAVAFPERASAGWQPLWFIANDGLWNFSKKGHRLTRDEIRDAPSSKNKAFARFDTHAISPEYRVLWELAAQRKILRDQMLLILARDAENRTLLKALFNAETFNDPDRWPSEEALDLHLQELSGQSDLFRTAQDEQVGPQGAPIKVSTSRALLTFELDKLPKASAVGPTFEDTGQAPIRLTAPPNPDNPSARSDLHEALAAKCRHLESLAAGSNRAKHILPALQSLVSTLEASASQSSSYLIWSYGNTLRRLHDAELRAATSEDPEAPPLPDRLGVLLSDVVEQFNIYAIADPIVGLLDRAKVGPERRSKSLQSLEVGIELTRAIRDTPGIVEPEAAQVLEAATVAAQNAEATSSFNADQAIVNAVEIQRNGARAILINALHEVRNVFSKVKGLTKLVAEGAAKQFGAEIIKQLPLASFVVGAQDIFTAIWRGVVDSYQVQYLVALIRDLISQLRP